MNRLIRCELFKEFKKNSFKILLIIILISSFLTCYISNKRLNNQYPIVEINNIKLNKIMDNGVTLLIFSSIIIIIMSSSILGNEINKKNIKELLTKPYNRNEILISKFISMYIIIFLITMFIFISYILFTYLLTIHNMADTSFISKYFIKFIINSVPIYFLSTFTIFLTTFIKNQKIIISINSLLFIMSPVILNFFLNIKFKYIIYTFIPYLDFSIFKNAYSISTLNAEYNMNFSMSNGIIILLIYNLLLLFFSLIIFNKKDFY